MLASTVQFSTYDQTPVTRPRQTRALPQETQRYEEQTGPEQRRNSHTPEGMARSLRTQQRAYEPVTAIQTPVHAHPEGHAVLGARDAGRPNWSAFHPRAPPHTLRRPLGR